MDSIIDVAIRSKVATRKRDGAFAVCDNTDYVIRFEFDAEWDEHPIKTARFRFGSGCRDIVFAGNECRMPLIHDCRFVEIGVFAGNLYTTTAARLPLKESIRGGSPAPVPPSEDVYDQIIEAIGGINTTIGNLNDLETADKSNLVAAINEAARTSSAGGDWSTIANKPFDTLGDSLKVESGILEVKTSDAVEGDNTLPITSAAVYTEVGNIGALLALI